jgi:hypothetical protein
MAVEGLDTAGQGPFPKAPVLDSEPSAVNLEAPAVVTGPPAVDPGAPVHGAGPLMLITGRENTGCAPSAARI